jgi:DNA-binding Xre family transcriptional regulator
MNLKQIEENFYKKTGTTKKRSDLAKLLFGKKPSAEVSLNRLFNDKAKSIKFEQIKIIAEFYNISPGEVLNSNYEF